MTLTHSPRYSLCAAVSIALFALASLASCGGSNDPVTGSTTLPKTTTPHSLAVVVQVGRAHVTSAEYLHWMGIGAATRYRPTPGRTPSPPVAYEPPAYAQCVSRLRAATHGSATAQQLLNQCRRAHESIQRRILNFLITGFWLRGEAAAQHLSLSEAQVRAKFNEERRANYPTAAAFRQFQEASHQTIPDLEFAVETQMLSTRLLERFTKAHPHEGSEQATIRAFNASISSNWIPRTSCATGYVVPDCREYKLKA